ncbi:MAG: hypothetical protein C4519_22710 [Desulfobacteraceae bacterium]|nr:MAG: hypothetical protein C4519_22710 [Desulfobacteraceae bacterium]
MFWKKLFQTLFFAAGSFQYTAVGSSSTRKDLCGVFIMAAADKALLRSCGTIYHLLYKGAPV